MAKYEIQKSWVPQPGINVYVAGHASPSGNCKAQSPTGLAPSLPWVTSMVDGPFFPDSPNAVLRRQCSYSWFFPLICKDYIVFTVKIDAYADRNTQRKSLCWRRCTGSHCHGSCVKVTALAKIVLREFEVGMQDADTWETYICGLIE